MVGVARCEVDPGCSAPYRSEAHGGGLSALLFPVIYPPMMPRSEQGSVASPHIQGVGQPPRSKKESMVRNVEGSIRGEERAGCVIDLRDRLTGRGRVDPEDRVAGVDHGGRLDEQSVVLGCRVGPSWLLPGHLPAPGL